MRVCVQIQIQIQITTEAARDKTDQDLTPHGGVLGLGLWAQSAADVRPWDMPRFFSVCPLILNPKFLFGGPLF